MKKVFLIFTYLLITVSCFSQWSLNGNAIGTNSYFLGTTDDKPIVFKRNSQWAGILDFNNVSLGYFSLQNALTSTGWDNTAFGKLALTNNTTGTQNVAMGAYALASNTTGSCNIAIGDSASYNQTFNVSYNIAIGQAALKYNQQSGNTAVGYLAGFNNTAGQALTAIGFNALYSNTTGSYNTALGQATLTKNTTGGLNVGIGSGALGNNTTASNNTAVGASAMNNNTTGQDNTAVGKEALKGNIDGLQNTAVGSQALSFGSGKYNTAVGFKAAQALTSGTYNVSIGWQALMTNSNGDSNIAIGASALYSNTIGYNNVATGHRTLYYNTSGEYNVANGYFALSSNTNGTNNVANGGIALYANTSGVYNTAIGFEALRNNTTGILNTAIGYDALYSNTNGNNNTAMGYLADVSVDGLLNATAIGYNAKATAGNQVTIGNSNVTSIRGYVPWTNISDGRVKKNVKQDVPGLAFIKKLQPVTYNLDLDAADRIMRVEKPKENEKDSFQTVINLKARTLQQKKLYTGFVAQDVEKAAQSIGYDFSGVDVSDSVNGLYGLRYSEFVMPLVKAVQELSAQNDAKDSVIVSMQQQIDLLQDANDEIMIDSLKEQITELNKLVNLLLEKGNSPVPSNANVSSVFDASLAQNYPNPFNQATTINYILPQTFQSAKIVITNASGKIFRQILVTGSGTGALTIKTESLSAGTYFYSLSVDNTLIDTKKMILTK